MSDLIERQRAIELVRDICDAIMSGCGCHYDAEVDDEVFDDILEVDAILKCNKEIRTGLQQLPSAQPEIIHCKGCKYYNDHTEECYNDKGLRFLDYSNLDEMYCAWAERREE